MKSSVVAALGGLAVLGRAQQSASNGSSGNNTIATIPVVDVKPSPKPIVIPVVAVKPTTKPIVIPVVDVKPNTKPIVIPVPTTVVSHDASTVTMKKWATVTATRSQQPSPVRPGGDRYPEPSPTRRPHGSVQPYFPGQDTTKNPAYIIDPMNACARGYSCQPDYEREHHGGVHRVGDDCHGHCKRDDGDCRAGCDASAADKWTAPAGCRKLCGGGSPGYTSPGYTSSRKHSHRYNIPVHNGTGYTSFNCPSGPSSSSSSSFSGPGPGPGPGPSPSPSPSGCPAGLRPCPYRYGNGTIVPPATVTTAGAAYIRPAAGVAMVVAGVFGLLMA
ncbi:hypothetical protein VMCG_07651 [Cytospora schulzeri]|uniref:Uncharacterized protein n=1 Tax=Cytospora schulzeri TaxID=448051 RepID=A0A423VYX1_9PEZI|nr:hypothetical protein VMCG_07651 [Valsa malicola]